MILRNPAIGIADEAHDACLQIGEAADRVEHRTRDGIGIECVHREVAACGVLIPRVRERDDRVAPVGADVMTQRRHLDRTGREDGGDGAMSDAGGDGTDTGGLQAGKHIVGQQARREVDVGGVEPQQRIAHHAADEPGLVWTAKRLDQRRKAFARAQAVEVQGHAHASCRDRLTSIAAVAPQIRRSCQRIS